MLESTYPAHYLRQVLAVAHFDDEFQRRVAIVSIRHFYMHYVRLLIGNDRGDLGQGAALVGDVDPDIGWKLARYPGFPFNVDPLVRVVPVLGNVGARLKMNDDTASGGHEAQDRIAGNGAAALGKIDHHSLRALDQQWQRGFAVGLGLAGYRPFSRKLPRDDRCHAVAESHLL